LRPNGKNIGQKIKHLPPNNSEKPKHYVLDMFPYPSAGLHVGHPLGYIALMCMQDIKDINVLQPMGYDSFDCRLNNAIQTGQRPEDTTSVNIDGFDKEGNKSWV
jgi:leucyl-tRNA synthetase